MARSHQRLTRSLLLREVGVETDGGAGTGGTLVDPVPLHIEQARAGGVAHASVGDARSLPYDDDTFGDDPSPTASPTPTGPSPEELAARERAKRVKALDAALKKYRKWLASQKSNQRC